MKSTTNRKWRLFTMCASVGLALLLGSGRSVAQGMGSSGGSGGFSGGSMGGGSSFGGSGFGGSSSFGGAGFSGSSSFGGAGFSGSSFGSGSFSSNSSFGSSAFGNGGSTFSSFSGSGGTSRFNNNANSGFPTVGTTNAFASYYLNPMSQGLVGGTTGSSQNEFGMPLYGTNALATTTTNSTVTPNTVTFAPSGSPLLAPYVFSMTPASTGGRAAVSMNATPLVTELREILDRSTALTDVRNNIQVGSVGGVIVLRGRVNDEHERRIAEGLLRLTPGVHEIRNELLVPTATTTLPPPTRRGG